MWLDQKAKAHPKRPKSDPTEKSNNPKTRIIYSLYRRRMMETTDR